LIGEVAKSESKVKRKRRKKKKEEKKKKSLESLSKRV
jgi:hypothetical protein